MGPLQVSVRTLRVALWLDVEVAWPKLPAGGQRKLGGPTWSTGETFSCPCSFQMCVRQTYSSTGGFCGAVWSHSVLSLESVVVCICVIYYYRICISGAEAIAAVWTQIRYSGNSQIVPLQKSTKDWRERTQGLQTAPHKPPVELYVCQTHLWEEQGQEKVSPVDHSLLCPQLVILVTQPLYLATRTDPEIFDFLICIWINSCLALYVHFPPVNWLFE